MPNPNPVPFKKTGADANPNGRPKRDWTFASLLEEALEEQDETGIPYKKILMRKLRTIAAKGDTTAIKMVMDRLDGLPPQPLKHSGEINIPTPIYGGKATDSIK